MNEIEKYTNKIFEDIKHIDENGNEYWEARELAKILEYSRQSNLKKVIAKSIEACNNSNYNIFDHFAEVGKTIKMPKGATKQIIDYKLSRYACYLIVQNGNPNKEVIALDQTYFTIQTRKQELTEIEFSNLSEDEKRLYTRKIVKNKRSKLIFTSFYILSFSNLSNIFVKHSGSSLVNSIYFFVLG